MNISTVDVLVAGAGPVGMTLAVELAIQGVAFRIVDKQQARSSESRAIGVHSRTLEVFNRYGAVEELLTKAGKVMGNVFWMNGKRFDGFKGHARPDTRFSGIHTVSQADTEAFLASHLAGRGVSVEHPVTVKSVVQDNDAAATVILTKSDGSEEIIRAKYVVGCDGAHSVVRHSMDVEFQGDAYAQEFILADTMIDWHGFGDKTYTMLGDRLMMLFPLAQGRAYIVLSRSTDPPSNDDPKLEDFRNALAERLPAEESPKLHDPFWLARFRLHHRCATKYRNNRLFVAGDAAHIHSPIGGQGMNTGINDSVNLAWKLARVLNGAEPDSFLDTYQEERLPVGQHLLNHTDQMFTFLTSEAPIMKSIRTILLPQALPSIGTSEIGPKLINYFSGLDVKYRRSSIVHTASGFVGPVRGGFRAPDGHVRAVDGKQLWLQDLLKGPGYHMLVFPKATETTEVEQAKARFFSTKVDTVPAQVHIITSHTKSENPKALVDVNGELHKRYGFDVKPGFAYIRPDGYIENMGFLH